MEPGGFNLGMPVTAELMKDVGRGGSVAQAKRVAQAVVQEGGASSSTAAVARLGGDFASNAERHLHELSRRSTRFLRSVKVSYITLTILDVKAMGLTRRRRRKNCTGRREVAEKKTKEVQWPVH